MPHLQAAILILIDRPHQEKQWAIAAAAAAAEHLRVLHLCHDWHACMSLVLARSIGTVICALDPGEEIRSAIETAGGRVIVAREATGRIRRSVTDMVARLTRVNKGMDSQEIAYVLDVPTSDVRKSLAEIRRRESRE